MRVLYIHQFFATRESNLGLIRSYEFSRRWVEQGHEVTIITSSSRLPESYSKKLIGRGTIDGIDIRSARISYSNYMNPLRRVWSFSLFMLNAIYLALSGPKPDVVLATSTPLTVGVPGLAVSLLRGVPLVFEVRDLWPEAAIQMGVLKRSGPIARIAKTLERMLYRRAKNVIALSPGMAEGVLAEGTPAERVHVVPNSSDLDLFSPGPKDEAFVDQYNLGDSFVVGYAGAIGPSNALEDSVPEAARILLEQGRRDIVFLIAGNGKSLPLLQLEKERLGLDNLLLIGSLPKRDVPRLTRTADLLMTLFADVPILATNSPNKFFDALASGRPVLVNQPGWTKDLIETNDAGAWVPAGDGEAMAQTIVAMADDRKAAARKGRNARALAERKFSRTDLSDQVMAILKSTVEASA